VPWPVVDALIALLAVLGLALVLLRLWRQVKGLSRQVSQSSKAVGDASDALLAAQGPMPPRR
jgi:hypothetical protein